MAAYMVFICKKIHDRSEMEAYWDEAPASLEGVNVSSVASYPPFEVVEGNKDIEGVTVLKFPTAEEARAWYNSDSYRKAREHRFKGAEYFGILFDDSKTPRESRMRNKTKP